MGEFHDFYWFHIHSFLFLLWKWNGSESVFWLWSMLTEQNGSLGLTSTRCTKNVSPYSISVTLHNSSWTFSDVCDVECQEVSVAIKLYICIQKVPRLNLGLIDNYLRFVVVFLRRFWRMLEKYFHVTQPSPFKPLHIHRLRPHLMLYNSCRPILFFPLSYYFPFFTSIYFSELCS